MITTSTKKLKASDPLKPWNPVMSGLLEGDTDMMLMASKK